MIPVDGKEGPADICVIELGGTIGEQFQPTVFIHSWLSYFVLFVVSYIKLFSHPGDIESMPFIEALGQFSYRVGKDCSLFNIYDHW